MRAPSSCSFWKLMVYFWKASRKSNMILWGGVEAAFLGIHGTHQVVQCKMNSIRLFFSENTFAWYWIELGKPRYSQVQCTAVMKRSIMCYIFERQTLWGYQIWYWEGVLRQSQKVSSISATAASAHQQHQRISASAASVAAAHQQHQCKSSTSVSTAFVHQHHQKHQQQHRISSISASAH